MFKIKYYNPQTKYFNKQRTLRLNFDKPSLKTGIC